MSAGKIVFLGLAQALGTAIYCALVAFFLMSSGTWFARPNVALAIATFLLLFILSACITGGLVLGYPGYLVLRQRVQEGLLLLISTVAWLILFFGLSLLSLLIWKPL